jgi:DNA mismatch endonuclease (patch repair protein)
MKLKTTPQRSRNMSVIRGTENQTTELKLATLFRKNGISGWRRHVPGIYGRPDFVFRNEKIAVFVDGCFWHGCREIKKMPVANRRFWIRKLGNNRKRDIAVGRELKKAGWRVVRLWEHELKRSPDRAVQKIKKRYD